MAAILSRGDMSWPPQTGWTRQPPRSLLNSNEIAKLQLTPSRIPTRCDKTVSKIRKIFTDPTYYNDVIMGTMASQITSLTIAYSTIYSGTDQRKHQSSASLASVRGIRRWPVNSPHKGQVTGKLLTFDDAIMTYKMLLSLTVVWVKGFPRSKKNKAFGNGLLTLTYGIHALFMLSISK